MLAILTLCALDLGICVLITAFLRFHIALASENKTTIERLEHFAKPYKSEYDMGVNLNWAQIFG